MNAIASWLRGFGALRLALFATVAALIALGPFSGGTVRFEGVAMLTTLVAPAFYVIIVFLLPLDMTMTAIFMTDPARRERLRRVLITEAVLFVLLLLAWLPFVLRLLRVR